ncbi:efflux transporter periplasmic adaptor subunit, partial [Shewanella sp.]|nr:efflux transporter periplasmic adaptor subunit [Shewanella sp.]
HVYVDAYPTEPFEGIISAIEPAVFYQSGLIQVQAQIPNTDSKLRSGMFAKVDIQLAELTNQIVLPQTAISFTLYGNSVYIIEDKVEDGKSLKRVKQVNVKVLERGLNNALITGDIKAGDMIVTSGQVRLSNGSKVSISDNDVLTPPATLPQL